ncbi:hypothetical protein EWE75_15785 [Sphingomonas populi]|uniref:Uncharacterized protein n=1 Tax=Sphingomonas populi TaxID=2484750 RepID=A0A4Q6Y2K0_9SPHN|nr:hypothetical protein EWE75_15785 [Sphingomonas populi]
MWARVEKTVFWSWQSDLDPRVTKDLVRYALDEAVKQLAADLEEADRPSVTSDTQGVAGTPDIVATILRKIDEAAVFVGDVTPIALSQSGKACANPNVLLEMGYANKSLREIHVRLGANGLSGSFWPGGPLQFDDEGYEAVEDTYEYDTTLIATTPEALKAVVVEAFNGLAAVYGVEAHSFEQISERSRY